MNGNRDSITFLKVIIFLVGIVVLALCTYWIPVLTIRDAKAHFGGDYSLYPLLVCVYGICMALSFTLYQVYKLLIYIERNSAFSELSLKSLKVIKKCAFTAIFFIVLMIISLKVISSISGDDSAGPISLSLIGILVTSTVAAFVSVLQKPIENFLEKNERKM